MSAVTRDEKLNYVLQHIHPFFLLAALDVPVDPALPSEAQLAKIEAARPGGADRRVWAGMFGWGPAIGPNERGQNNFAHPWLDRTNGRTIALEIELTKEEIAARAFWQLRVLDSTGKRRTPIVRALSRHVAGTARC